ncbi:MAG: 5-methyltetrahydropteroyltriglutamate--homocysteine S-methyltransferase, partial [Beijerinckiaceae bacterium]
MPASAKPPFRADHVGSFLRTDKLKDARNQFREGKIKREELTKLEDEAIKDVVKLQKDAGLSSATDGELRRQSWSGDFLNAIGNVTTRPSQFTLRFQTREGERRAQPPGFYVEGKMSLPEGGIFTDHFRYLKSVCSSDVTPKL